ncbi:hypothetical protein STEG23_029081, partial [Scotinomys teguina]
KEASVIAITTHVVLHQFGSDFFAKSKKNQMRTAQSRVSQEVYKASVTMHLENDPAVMLEWGLPSPPEALGNWILTEYPLFRGSRLPEKSSAVECWNYEEWQLPSQEQSCPSKLSID